MQTFQISFFYDLQEFIRSSSLPRKYYPIFKALDLSALKDKNTGVEADGYSNRAKVEQTTYYESVAIKNQMTIAHLAAAAITVAAGVLLKQPILPDIPPKPLGLPNIPAFKHLFTFQKSTILLLKPILQKSFIS
jgi:hypothetical protein